MQTQTLQVPSLTLSVHRSGAGSDASTASPFLDPVGLDTALPMPLSTVNGSTPATVDTHVLSWAFNPFSWADTATTPRRAGGVVTVEVFDGATGAALGVGGGPVPAVVALPVPLSVDAHAFQCAYWVEGAQTWGHDGTVRHLCSAAPHTRTLCVRMAPRLCDGVVLLAGEHLLSTGGHSPPPPPHPPHTLTLQLVVLGDRNHLNPLYLP